MLTLLLNFLALICTNKQLRFTWLVTNACSSQSITFVQCGNTSQSSSPQLEGTHPYTKFEHFGIIRFLLKLGADDTYVRAVRPGRTYGPDVRACFLHPYVRHVTTSRTYGSSAPITRTNPYVRAVCTARTVKALSYNAFSSYGPYVRVMCTELPYVRPVKPRDFTLLAL